MSTKEGGVVDVTDAMESEARTHGDMAMVDLVESYSNLTLKSVVMLKYLRDVGLNSAFYIKVLLLRREFMVNCC